MFWFQNQEAPDTRSPDTSFDDIPQSTEGARKNHCSPSFIFEKKY